MKIGTNSRSLELRSLDSITSLRYRHHKDDDLFNRLLLEVKKRSSIIISFRNSSGSYRSPLLRSNSSSFVSCKFRAVLFSGVVKRSPTDTRYNVLAFAPGTGD